LRVPALPGKANRGHLKAPAGRVGCATENHLVGISRQKEVVFGHLLQRGFRRRRLAAARNLGGDFVSSASLSIVMCLLSPLWGGPPALSGGRATFNHPKHAVDALPTTSLAPDPR
jgi:hypothetical protein